MRTFVLILAAILTVWLSACSGEFGQYTPECTKPELGVLSYPTYATIREKTATAYIVNADLREEYCSAYITRYLFRDAQWQAELNIELPEVRPGVSEEPVFAQEDDNEVLWLADRRGRALVPVNDLSSTGSLIAPEHGDRINVGFDIARFVIADNIAYATDATAAFIHIIPFDASARAGLSITEYVVSITTEALAIANNVIATDEWVLVSQAGSGFVSRLRRDNHSFDNPIVAFSGGQNFSPSNWITHPNGDIYAVLEDRNTIVRMSAAANFEVIAESAELIAPSHIRYTDQLIVHDRLGGSLVISEDLQELQAIAGSPNGDLMAYAPQPATSPLPSIGAILTESDHIEW